MQQHPTPPSASASPAATWITTYGPFILSVLALLIIAAAWFMHAIDQTTALAVIGAILIGNGLVTSTQWQAAPGLLGQMQTIIGQFASHIQTLHAQQVVQQPTAVLRTVQAPAPPSPQAPAPVRTSTPAPSQPQPPVFLSPANSFGVSGAPTQTHPSAPVSWQQSHLGG